MTSARVSATMGRMRTSSPSAPSRSGVLLLLILAAASACRTSAPVAPQASPAPPPAATAAAVEPDSVKWVRVSAEYEAAVRQAYVLATARVETASPRRQANQWAVVLDADETVISNLVYQRERALAGLPFTQDSWGAWVARREATPLPGAARFLIRVRELGGRIAIVTNRLGSECDATRDVFRQHGLVHDVMLCRPDKSPSDKNPRFQSVASGEALGSGALDIVLFVGDNILDFPNASQAWRQQGETALVEFGQRFILIPNPMYGSWQ